MHQQAEESIFPELRVRNREYGDHGLSGLTPEGGLSRRDFFAAAALQGLIAGGGIHTDPDQIAEKAISFADATLEALED